MKIIANPTVYSGRTNLSKAAFHRKKDAVALLKERRWRGAMYLGGYAIECKLKVQLLEYYDCFHLDELEAKIEAQTGSRPSFMTIHGHNLEYLLGFAHCRERLMQNREIYKCFLICNRWDHRWRYAGNLGNEEEATYFMECLEKLYAWLSSNI